VIGQIQSHAEMSSQRREDTRHVVETVDGVEMRDVVAKVEGRGTVALRQPMPDRPELEQRFTTVLVRLNYLSAVLLCPVILSVDNITMSHNIIPR